MSCALNLDSSRRLAVVLLCLFSFQTVCLPALADYDVPSYDDGLNKMSRRDFDGAILEFNRAIGYNHRNAAAFFKRGQCFYYLQNFQLAIDDFSAAINCDANNSDYCLWRGATYAKMGDNPHSIKNYVESLRMDPKLLQAANGAPRQEEAAGLNSPMFEHGQRAAVREERAAGKKAPNQQSVRNYLEAVRIVNENILPKFAPGTVFSGIIRPEFPEDQQASFMRPEGLAEIVANPKATLESCRKQLEMNPRDPAGHFRRALAFELLGKTQRALDDFADAILQESNNPRYMLARAFLQHMNHDETAASNDIVKAHEVDPSVPAIIKFQ